MWLQAIDRTRQTNGFLEYNDPEGVYPRLLTRGLDHHPPDTSYESTAMHHRRNCYHRALTQIAISKKFCQHLLQRRPTSPSGNLQSLSKLVIQPHATVQTETLLPFIFQFPDRYFNSTHVPQRPNNPNTTPLSRQHQPSPLSSNPTPTSSSSSSSTSRLFPIFSNSHLSEHAYIRHTRRGIKRSTSCPPQPTHAEDPYGRHEWDLRMKRKKEVKAHLRFF
jgi:hypothetical protein